MSDAQLVEALRTLVEDQTPHNRLLRIRLASTQPATATCVADSSDDFAGVTNDGAVHEGVIMALIDVAAGAAVCMRLGKISRIATRELRLDFLGPANCRDPIVAEAQCYRVERPLAFVRALAHQGRTEQPIASAQGTFIVVDEEPA